MVSEVGLIFNFGKMPGTARSGKKARTLKNKNKPTTSTTPAQALADDQLQGILSSGSDREQIYSQIRDHTNFEGG